mgnify:CR=1 FL=1
MPRSELTAFIAKEMRDQISVDDRYSTAVGAVVELQADPASAMIEPPRSTQEFYPILIDGNVVNKGKHKQRTMIIQRGAFQTRELFALKADPVRFRSSKERRGGRRRCF